MHDLSRAETPLTNTIEPVHTARCPECDLAISVAGEITLGRQLCCQKCGAVLEIVALSPLAVDYAFVAPLNLHHPLLLD